jgi:hypothetical protein
VTSNTVARAVQSLHAVISRRPHSAAIYIRPQTYLDWANEVEKAANAVRDAYEIERRERAAP